MLHFPDQVNSLKICQLISRLLQNIILFDDNTTSFMELHTSVTITYKQIFQILLILDFAMCTVF
jgi:hypothetical protein